MKRFCKNQTISLWLVFAFFIVANLMFSLAPLSAYAKKLKVVVRDDILSINKYDLTKIANYVATEVPKKFVRRQFAEFSYIKVEPSNNAVMITFFIVTILSIGLALFNVLNGVDLGRRYGRRRF